MELYDKLDEKQRCALHGVLVLEKRVVVVSGPAGTGKSALIEIIVMAVTVTSTRVGRGLVSGKANLLEVCYLGFLYGRTPAHET